jgi:hypothetical protein
MTLVPDPTGLELHSPALGPWFIPNIADPLPLPDTDDLAIDVTLNGVSWLPPASGFLSFYIVTDPRPTGLAGLRQADGNRAFADGSFVAVFRLLSWVERRLDALAAVTIPTIAQPATPGVPTRPIVRYLALELTTAPSDIAALEALLPDAFVFPAGATSDEDKAAHLGLTWDGTSLGNGPVPMTDLLQPGQFVPETNTFQELLQFPTSTPARLWSFDHRGRPLDAGAVAAWWNLLATNFAPDLWADGVVLNDRRTAPVADGLVFHLVNAHEGPLDQTTIDRLNLNGATGTGVVQTANNNSGVTVRFTAAPIIDADDLPQPVAAVLPDGVYTSDPPAPQPGAIQAWPNGALNNLARDFARIGIMSVEHQLVGQKRTAPSGANGAVARRAADQNRPSTGVRPARSLRGALQASTDAVLTALATPTGGGQQATLVASEIDRDAGPVTPTLPAIAPPTTPPTLTAVALEGGGVADGSIALGQRVLVTASVGTNFQGAWVRVWPLGFDHRTGEHIRLDGGAAPVDAHGVAPMVVPLPDGTVSEDDPPRLGVDVMVVTQPTVATQAGQALFPDLRIDRPFPAATVGRVPLGSATPPLLVCSTGAQQTGLPLANGSVPSGSEVVGLGANPPELIDRSTIPAAAFATSTVINLLTGGDRVELTESAFQTQTAEPLATGEGPTALAQTGATVQQETRQPFTAGGFWEAGFPLPGMERLEVVLAHPPDTPSGFNGAAVVGSTPLLGDLHELPFHHQGHPGGPAAPEVHGTGVLATGSASVAFAEYTRDRTIRSTVDLVTAATSPIDNLNTPTANSLWIAALRTEAAGVAAEIGFGLLANGLGYPFDGTWDDVLNVLSAVLTALPGEDPGVSARRALDRRILAAAYGAREGATAIVAAIQRAEDFVYIETPAFDDVAFGDTDDGDEVALWDTLIARMDANPSLHVAVCVPFHLLPGAPAELQRVRDQVIASALTQMAGGTRDDRFVAFSPAAGPARSLRIAGTTVVVDDAVAFAGTTHLWRRGLSFDSSLAAAVLDEALLRGRSQEVTNFRTTLMAGQLGIPANQVPLDPVDTVRAIREMVERGGFQRLAPERIRPPDPTLTTVNDDGAADGVTDVDIWNPDGSFPDLDPLGWLLGLQTAV